MDQRTIETTMAAQRLAYFGIHTSRTWILWYARVAMSCCASFVFGCVLVGVFRRLCRLSNAQWKLTALVFLTPISMYLILASAAQRHLCDRVVADAFSFGVVLGLLYMLNFSSPVGKAAVKLIAHRVGASEVAWLDSLDANAGEARSKLAAALKVPVSRVCLESGKGSLVEDEDTALLPLLSDSVTTDFFGFTTVHCHFSLREEDPSIAPSDPVRRHSDGKFMSMVNTISNSLNKINFGQNITLFAKVYSKKTDSRDVRPLTISPVSQFAAAAPSRGLMDGQSLSVRLLSWHSVKAGDSEMFSENGTPSEDFGDAGSWSGRSAQSSPKSRLGAKGVVAQVAGKLLARNLDSSLPVRNGDIVVVESDGKFMSVAKGWWMAWYSSTPRRSGAFKIEILERGEGLEQQFEKGLTKIKDKMNSSMMNVRQNALVPPQPAAAAAAAAAKVAAIEPDAVLRAGDHFRLRSMKFPDFELGVTSDKIKDDFCYLGLRKIAADDMHGNHEEWAIMVRFSVKVKIV